MPSKPWAVVNTQPHRQLIACENLKRQEFLAYCPMVRRQVTHARRSREVLRPLFPGYLFVRIDLNTQIWRPILSTIGVRSLVRFGEQLAFIDNDFIEGLKSREIDSAVARPADPYRIGQRLRITHGAFEGLIATIVEMDERDRVTVLMDLLSRPVRVKLDADRLSAV